MGTMNEHARRLREIGIDQKDLALALGRVPKSLSERVRGGNPVFLAVIDLLVELDAATPGAAADWVRARLPADAPSRAA